MDLIELMPLYYTKAYAAFYTALKHQYICNSYTMDKSALPDIYAQTQGPQARGRVRIYRQSTSAHGITNMFYFSM